MELEQTRRQSQLTEPLKTIVRDETLPRVNRYSRNPVNYLFGIPPI